MGRATKFDRHWQGKQSISIHALRGEGDGRRLYIHQIGIRISIHALRGEGDRRARALGLRLAISIHALRGEGDRAGLYFDLAADNFNPRPPWGGRPPYRWMSTSTRPISIHALRGEGDRHAREVAVEDGISIHALRGEGDCDQTYILPSSSDFNPRPPWGGRRAFAAFPLVFHCYFNPRPPWGGRQNPFKSLPPRGRDFNPRPPWGGRPGALSYNKLTAFYFNPRPPWGGRRLRAPKSK